MRINVYAEELTQETEVITKTVHDLEFGTRTFYGIRLYLESPAVLHHSTEDDDRSAITFWVPWTREGGHDFAQVTRAISALGVQAFHALADADAAGEKLVRPR